MTHPESGDHRSTQSIGSPDSSRLSALLELATGDSVADASIVLSIRDRSELALRLDEMCSGDSWSGQTLVDSLIAPETSLAELQRVKDLAKELIDRAKTRR